LTCQKETKGKKVNSIEQDFIKATNAQKHHYNIVFTELEVSLLPQNKFRSISITTEEK